MLVHENKLFNFGFKRNGVTFAAPGSLGVQACGLLQGHTETRTNTAFTRALGPAGGELLVLFCVIQVIRVIRVLGLDIMMGK